MEHVEPAARAHQIINSTGFGNGVKELVKQDAIKISKQSCCAQPMFSSDEQYLMRI